jgi:hypothetical protein
MSHGTNNQLPSTKQFDQSDQYTPPTLSNHLAIDHFKFLVRENGGIIQAACRDQLIIGRRGSMTHVDVDLADFEARDLGVSRNHCMLEFTGDRVLVRDMESVNGTFLNGQQLSPMRGYEVNHG